MPVYTVSLTDGTTLANLAVAAGRGPKGDGFTGGSFNASTGIVTFTSNDGLGFATGDLRGNLTDVDITGGTIDGTVIGGSTPAAISGTTITGTSFATTGNMTFGDNDRAIFGAGSDLQIYHDGNASYVSDQGTGNLRLDGTDVQIRSASGANMAAFVAGAEVQLYHNNIKKLATTATGIDVTGTVTADGLAVEGTTDGTEELARFGNNAGTQELIIEQAGSSGYAIKSSVDLRLYADYDNDTSDGGSNIEMYTDGTQRMSITGSTGDISFFEDTGTTPKFFWDASAERLGLGTTTPAHTLDVVTNTSAFASKIENQGTSFSRQGLLLKGGSTSEFYGLSTTTSNSSCEFGFRIRGGSTPAVWASTEHPVVFGTNNTERLRITSAGNVGIGTSNPARQLSVFASSGDGFIQIANATTGSAFNDGFQLSAQAGTGDAILNNLESTNMKFFIANTERARIDASGNLLVGKTITNLFQNGFAVLNDGQVRCTSASQTPLTIRRNTDDGDLIKLFKDATAVGSIGSRAGVVSTIVLDPRTFGGKTGVGISGANQDSISPTGGTGDLLDNGISLGQSTVRFKDLYLSGGVYLGGTGSANLLDDYEEGTFTPSFNIVSAVTYLREGFYRKVGGLVYVHGRLFIVDSSVISGESGGLRVEGLPFANAGTEVVVPVAVSRWGTATASNIFGTIAAGNSYVDMHYDSWITGTFLQDVDKTTVRTSGTNQNIVRFSFSYPVS